ncbi:MAG: response regulator [Polyangiaceae bacterium]
MNTNLAVDRSTQVVKPIRVFLAEDDEPMRTLVSSMLRNEGYDVVEATNGRDMLFRIRDAVYGTIEQPDVIVMDVRMPGYSGLAVLATLRRARWSTPVILMSAFADDDVRMAATELGATLLLDKPFDIDVLETAVAILSPFRATPITLVSPAKKIGPS